jgi:hypothetical protein
MLNLLNYDELEKFIKNFKSETYIKDLFDMFTWSDSMIIFSSKNLRILQPYPIDFPKANSLADFHKMDL